jgi:hypothetical protein
MSGRIERNMGRVELYAVLEDVKALQDAGYDYKKIHAQLAESGQVTMSYSTFCFQLKKLAEKQGLPQAALPASPASRSSLSLGEPIKERTSSPKAPGGVVRQGRDVPFNVNKSPDLNDFI